MWKSSRHYLFKYVFVSSFWNSNYTAYIKLFEVVPQLTDPLLLSFDSVLFWTVSTVKSLSSLLFSFAMSNLLLIPSSIFFILDTVFFNFRSLTWVFYICAFLIFPCFPLSFEHMEDIYVIQMSLSLSTKSFICAISQFVFTDSFLTSSGVWFSTSSRIFQFFIWCQTLWILRCWLLDFIFSLLSTFKCWSGTIIWK